MISAESQRLNAATMASTMPVGCQVQWLLDEVCPKCYTLCDLHQTWSIDSDEYYSEAFYRSLAWLRGRPLRDLEGKGNNMLSNR